MAGSGPACAGAAQRPEAPACPASGKGCRAAFEEHWLSANSM